MTESPQSQEAGISEYWQIVWQRRAAVLLALVIAIIAVIGIDHFRTREYSATANILFISQNFSNGTPVELTGQDIVTQIQLVQGTAVKELATHLLGSKPPKPSVAEVGLTATANITVSSVDPKFAARAANAYANAYIKDSQFRFLAQSQSAEAGLQKQIDALQTQLNSIQSEVTTVPTAQISSLTTQLGNLGVQQETLRTQLTQIQVNAAQAPSGGQLIQSAIVPSSPSSPKPVTDVIIAALLGLILGIGIALLREFSDDRIKTRIQLDELSGEIPTLGVLPRIANWKNSKTAVLVAAQHPKSPPAEAYRGLRTSIQFMILDRSTRLIEITSSSASEGKTTTAANLAVTLAETGQSVILVGCDLRKPRVHTFFNLPNDVGFTSVLLGKVSLEEACLPIPDFASLAVMPSGPIPPNPSELLGSGPSRELLQKLGQIYDYVLIDSPPLLPVTDAVVLATIADSVIVVCSAGLTAKKDLTRGLTLLQRVDAPVFGITLNMASEDDSDVYYRYGEGYGGYGYGESASGEKSGRRRSKGEASHASPNSSKLKTKVVAPKVTIRTPGETDSFL